jgi:hypothetical protein
MMRQSFFPQQHSRLFPTISPLQHIPVGFFQQQNSSFPTISPRLFFKAADQVYDIETIVDCYDFRAENGEWGWNNRDLLSQCHSTVVE